MSLSGRFSTLYLSTLALVLVGFSAALYISARDYLDRQVRDRLDAALTALAAAAEVDPDGVEWEPQERILTLGQETGAERLRWIVFDGQGRRIDRSRNWSDADLAADWTPGPGNANLPAQSVDRRGRTWRISQRPIGPGAAPASGSKAKEHRQDADDSDPAGVFFPTLVLTVCAPLDPTRATLAALGWFLVALGGGIWLLAALLCRWLSRRALSPLTRMVESARGLDATDPGWRLEEAGTRDELDDLGRAFNDLLARLHVAFERQRRFSSDASHQLRTPLTVLIGQIEVAMRQDRSVEEYRRVLRSALNRAVQLGQIVEALLFLGRAEADAKRPVGAPLELKRWVAAHLASRPATGRSAEIVLHAEADVPLRVWMHPALLGQLLDNLLDNACKYGQPGTPIHVETRGECGTAVLAVEDVGPGIPPEDLPHVFEPFFRSPQARRIGAAGVGLGLAVAQRIAVTFGGAITVRSEPGRGCRFEVRFPMVGKATQDGEPAIEEIRTPGDDLRSPSAHRPGRPAPVEACPIPEPTPRKIRFARRFQRRRRGC